MFTDAVLDVLSESLPPNHPLVIASVEKHAEIGTTTGDPSSTPPLWDQGLVTWAPFHRLKHPLWVDASDSNPGEDMGGLGILPITVWGSGQRHSEAGWFNDVEACVNHRFGRTWKKGWWEYFFG